MKDVLIETEYGSLYQYGDFNNRIYVIRMSDQEPDTTIDFLMDMAISSHYTKIVIKVKQHRVPLLLSRGFVVEAMIPLFDNHTSDVFFMSKFYGERALICEQEIELLNSYPALIKGKKNKHADKDIRSEILCDKDVCAISELFKEVFASYPYPVHDPGYIKKMMREDTCYFGIFKEDKLIAVSSAEVESTGRNAEMTDFAVHPDFRGQNLASYLLLDMEWEMAQRSIDCLFTIARLREPAMNKTFINSGYRYSGTLINNTQISGGIESMNVLYKLLR